MDISGCNYMEWDGGWSTKKKPKHKKQKKPSSILVLTVSFIYHLSIVISTKGSFYYIRGMPLLLLTQN